MNKKNLIFAMIFSSMFGGVIALGGYALFVKPETIQVVPASEKTSASFTNLVFDTTDYIVPEGLNFVYAAKSATPSVVHIRTVYEGGQQKDYYNPLDDFFRDYFDEEPRSERRPSRGAGSGVIISNDGYIVTNNHVVEGATEIEVQLNDNRTFSAEIVGLDPSTDLAVIKIDEKNLPIMKFGDSDNVNIGEWVLAVGNPFDFRSTVTAGIVSAKARNINILARNFRNSANNLSIESFIQTDAAVNPGNSGGALVNLKGELIGINTAIISPTGAFAGYSFAVPVSLVKKVTEDIVETGEVRRALLGIRIGDVDAGLAEREDLSVIRGVYVTSVNSGSAADEAGIESGDVIVAVDAQPVNTVAQLQERIALNRPGDEVEVTIMRGENKKSLKAVLKGTEQLIAANRSYRIEGAVFEEIDEDEMSDLDLEGGVKIADISKGKWSDAGMEEGFIITKIDKREIRSINDFRNYIENARGEGLLIEGIYPDGEKAYYGIGW